MQMVMTIALQDGRRFANDVRTLIFNLLKNLLKLYSITLRVCVFGGGGTW